MSFDLPNPDMTSLLVVGVAVLLSALATSWIRGFAIRRGLVDAVSSSRKIHKGPIPRLGGIAMAGAVTAAIGCAVLVDARVRVAITDQWLPSLALAGSLLAILAVGVVDDLKGVRARYKLLVQMGVAVALVAAGRGIHSAELLPGVVLPLHGLGPIVTVLWIVGVINALNLIDGLDGLAGGVALIAALSLALMALLNGDIAGALVPLAVVGAVAGFLLYNWHPASIFMGDTGSMMLGLLLAVSAIRVTGGAHAPTPVLVCALVLALPVLDTTLAFARRLLMGRSPFSADKEHLHHRILLHLGVDQKGAVLILLGLAGSFATVGMALRQASLGLALMLVGVAALGVAAVLWRLGYLDVVRRLPGLRRRNAVLRAQLRKAGQDIEKASDLEELWAAVEPLSDALDVSKLELHLDTPELREEVSFQKLRSGGASDPLLVQVPLGAGTGVRGRLIGVWRDGRVEVDRDHELALEWAAGKLQRALTGFGAGPGRQSGEAAAPGAFPRIQRAQAQGRGG